MRSLLPKYMLLFKLISLRINSYIDAWRMVKARR